MSWNLKENKSFLELLTQSHPLQQKALLVTATPSQIRSVCECILNALYGTIPIDHRDRSSLKPHRETLRALAEPSYPYTAKKKLLVQTGGGFLDRLIPLVLQAMTFLV